MKKTFTYHQVVQGKLAILFLKIFRYTPQYQNLDGAKCSVNGNDRTLVFRWNITQQGNAKA